MPIISYVPLGLTSLRAILAPVLIFLAMYYPSRPAFAACLVIAFLSDVFDGIIARRLNIVTSTLRRLDSIADSVFYLAAIFVAWLLYPSVIREHRLELAVLFALEIFRYIFDIAKFGCEASYHMWSSKLWGISLFIGFFALLVFGAAGIPITIAIYLGIIADLEGLAISIILKRRRKFISSI